MSQRPFRVTAGYLAAVALIYVVTTCGWLILGYVTSHRTSARDSELRGQVGELWGGEHTQVAPSLELLPPANASSSQPTEQPAEELPAACRARVELRPERTDAKARLNLEHRRKGLLWYSTYRVRFDGRYTFVNRSPCRREAQLTIPLPARGAIYDEFHVLSDGDELPVQVGDRRSSGAVASLTLAPGETRSFTVRYHSRGLDRWSYAFGSGTSRAKNFALKVSTNFAEVDFPDGTLSPSDKQRTTAGWALTWRFGNLLADANIAVTMPHRINPGPLSAEISLFAPVSLAFFYFVLLLVSVMRQVRLHPVHYAMLAAAFFAFHLLLAYLVDLIPLSLAFTIASATSVGLVVSYLRLAVGTRFALLWAGGAQLLYLVLFSLAFFLEGYTGLTITIFSVLTLFVVMQLTGRIDWSTRFGNRPDQAARRPVGAAGAIYGTALRSDAAEPPASEGEDAVFSRVS
jgi:hypothetical protein